MAKIKDISYTFKTQQELNHAYMPFIINGAVFIKSDKTIPLEEILAIHLNFSWLDQEMTFQGKVVWWTPLHALHHAVPGIGVQFIGEHAMKNKEKLEAMLDMTAEIGGYTTLSNDSFKIL